MPSHVRMYFLQKPNYVEPNPTEDEQRIEKLADTRFLERAGDNLKSIYQRLLIKASGQMNPAFDTEVWTEPDGSKMARLVIAFKVGATHSYFSSFADVYRAHGLFSSRKYVEFFSNGIVIHGFYLQQLTTDGKGKGAFEERIKACVADASMHFVLPRTSLSPMLRKNLLTVQETSYAYAAWKFAFHFLHRLPEAYTVVAEALRVKDPSAFARLDKLRNTMKFNTYTESQVMDCILPSAPLVKRMYQDFYDLHAPNGSGENVPESELESFVRKTSSSEAVMVVFTMFITFNRHILRTNFFQDRKAALAFRLDGNFLSDTEYPEKPYAVIYVIGSEFRGFHVRFLDIARGGIRMIRSPNVQVFARNVSSLFDECYSLASTQQRKNKDIPEGGSKGVILLNQTHQDKANVAFRKYIDALLDLMLPKYMGSFKKEEILFLGPDEGTAELMDWASSYAQKRGYRYWKAITTGKSATRGGIPHDVYGMTTHSVRQYVVGIQEKLGLMEGTITKVQTGGPDGDLGSNEILMSEREKTIAVVDGSGVLYDPEGIQREELVRLAQARSPVSGFDKSLIGADGYAVYVTEHEVTLPSGEIVENGTQFRNCFHLKKNLTADFFVPCGGRPSAVNLSNVEAFLYQEDGKTLRFKYIVEGANLFFTQDARLVLEKAGVILFKDASANKGGVTSSSLEVMAALSMKDDEFAQHMCVKDGKIPDFYKKYVSEVQKQIDMNAKNEFECLWKEHQENQLPLSVLSNQVSEKITNLTIKVQESNLWENQQLREQLLDKAIPHSLLKFLGRDTILERLPESYTRAVFASQLASRFVYAFGLSAPEFAFYEFVQKLS